MAVRRSIGRSTTSDIVLRDVTVAPLHAFLVVHDDGALELIDNRSVNGTFLVRDGVPTRIDATLVGPDDRVAIGGFETSIRELLDRLPG